MTAPLSTPKWFIAEGLTALKHAKRLGSKLPRTRRVKRRGFSRSVRRGDQIRYADRIWTVSRRSKWSLWLYEYLPMNSGDTVHVTLPKRFGTDG